MVVLIKVKELYITSLEKSITIIKTIVLDGREPPLLFIIALRQKIINN